MGKEDTIESKTARLYVLANSYLPTFVIFLMVLLKVESNYTTVLNPIILPVYGRQIMNKEISNIRS